MLVGTLETGATAELLQCLSSITEFQAQSLAQYKLGTVAHAYNPGFWEVEAE